MKNLKELEKLYRILTIAGSSLPCLLFLRHQILIKHRILNLRGGDSVITTGIDDCIAVKTPSYVNEERILRFLNDRFRHMAIKGIIYITKEAFCYLVATEGIVNFPVVLLERIKIDGVYALAKRVVQWTIFSIVTALTVGELIQPYTALMSFGSLWIYVHSIPISKPHIKEVDQLTGKYVPRIETRKDAIVFDSNKEPLPPVIEKSIKPVKVNTLDTEYEITDSRLVDVKAVSRLNNKFSDRRFTRPKPRMKKPGKTVYFRDMVKKWRDQSTNDEVFNMIDEMIKRGII